MYLPLAVVLSLMVVAAAAGHRRSGPYPPRRAARKIAHYGYGWPRHPHAYPHQHVYPYQRVYPYQPAYPHQPAYHYQPAYPHQHVYSKAPVKHSHPQGGAPSPQLGQFTEPGAKYHYAYRVEDQKTRDFKTVMEYQKDDITRGHYSYLQPNGAWLAVDYFAHPKTGYNTIVSSSWTAGGEPPKHVPPPSPVETEYSGHEVPKEVGSNALI